MVRELELFGKREKAVEWSWMLTQVVGTEVQARANQKLRRELPALPSAGSRATASSSCATCECMYEYRARQPDASVPVVARGVEGKAGISNPPAWILKLKSQRIPTDSSGIHDNNVRIPCLL